MLRSAEIMRARHEEIVDWLIHESGSTRIKAEIEWQMLHAITLESSSFPHRASGHVLPSDDRGKRSEGFSERHASF